MSTPRLIRRYIHQLPPQSIFVTRDLLAYGDRKSVDWITCFLVAKKYIVRLARGVFIRNDVGLKIPSIEEIVEAKARAFGKRIIPTLNALAVERGLKKPVKIDRRRKAKPDDEGVAQFSVIGCKGNFWTFHGHVTLKSIAPRKFFLHQEKVGRTILAMWHVTDDAQFCQKQLERREKFSRQDKKRIKEFAAWAPAWLQKYLYSEPPRSDISAPWSIFPLKNRRPEATKTTGPKVKESSIPYIVSEANPNSKIINIFRAEEWSRHSRAPAFRY